ncbi:bem46 protein, variant [Entomophthora muscae]|nr:bem46 protein, variant [Entomophthora muscae]
MPDYPPGSRTNIASPSRYGLDRYAEVELKCRDETIIVAYLICQPKISTSTDLTSITLEEDVDYENSLTILYFHANAGNIGHRLPIAANLYRQNKCNVLMVSYRGYGKSQGIPDESGIRQDSQAALDFILAHPQLSKGKIMIFGQSLGGAVAIDLASRNPLSIHGLILENTFLSIPKLVASLIPLGQCISGFCHQRWNSESRIHLLGHLPILFLYGTADELIHQSHMEGLFQASCPTASAAKSFVAFPGGTHNDTCTHPTYYSVVRDFLVKHRFIQ